MAQYQLVLKLGKVTDTLTNYPAQYFGLLQFLSEVSVTSRTNAKLSTTRYQFLIFSSHLLYLKHEYSSHNPGHRNIMR
jgi:hypothetical protein